MTVTMNEFQLELCQLEQMKREANSLVERKTRYKYPLRKQPTFSSNTNHCRKASKQNHRPPVRSYPTSSTETILEEPATKDTEYVSLPRQRSCQPQPCDDTHHECAEPLPQRSTSKASWRPKRILSVPFGRILSETTELTESVTQAIAQSTNMPVTTPPPSMLRFLSKSQSDESLQATTYHDAKSPTSGCVFFLGLADTQSSDSSNLLNQESTLPSGTFAEDDEDETDFNAISQSILTDDQGAETIDEDELESIAF